MLIGKQESEAFRTSYLYHNIFYIMHVTINSMLGTFHEDKTPPSNIGHIMRRPAPARPPRRNPVFIDGIAAIPVAGVDVAVPVCVAVLVPGVCTLVLDATALLDGVCKATVEMAEGTGVAPGTGVPVAVPIS